MEFSICDNSSEFVEKYLQHLQDETNKVMIPAVVMLVMFAVVGLVGNILVLLVYSQKMRLTPTKVIIMTIASIDLVANVGAIPSEINTLLHTWTLSHAAVCKSKVFLVTFTAVGGAISLCVVAVIRFRKVCRPYGWQVTIRQAIMASILTAITAFLFSIPYIIIFGSKTRQTPCPNIQGHECFADDYYFYTIWPLVNNALFLLLYVSLSVSMLVMYIMIGITAWKHSRFHGVSGAAAKIEPNTSSGSSSADKQSDISPKEIPKFQSTETSCSNNATIFRLGRVRYLFCCAKKHEDQMKGQCFMMKNNTSTTDTDTRDNNSGSVNSNINFTASDELENAKVNQANERVVEMSIRNTICAEAKSSERINNSDSLADNEERKIGFHSTTEYGDDMQNIQERETINLKSNFSSNKTGVNISTPAPVIKVANERKRRRPLGRMTAMLIIISAIFVFGYLPFLTLSVYKSKFREKYESLSMVELAIFDLFYRLYFINSASNPFIYSLCDMNFRRECINLLTFKGRRRL